MYLSLLEIFQRLPHVYQKVHTCQGLQSRCPYISMLVVIANQESMTLCV